MRYKIGIVSHFDAAHYLPGHPKCGSVHGHTYKVEVALGSDELKGDMIIDFGEFKKVVNSILSQFDHKVLNEVVDFVPTVENLAFHIHKLLLERGFDCEVKVWEGEGAWASYT